MNPLNAFETSSRGVLVDMYGPPKPAFYETLLPLVERLLSPHELELHQGWMKMEGGKSALVDDLLRRVNDLFAEIEGQKQAAGELDQTITMLKQEIQTRKTLAWEQHTEFCDAIDEASALETRVEQLELEVKMCRRHPLLVEKNPPIGNIQLSQTHWMMEWRAQAGFNTQSALLQIIGDTGLGRVPVIRERAAASFGYSKPSAGGISKAIEALEKHGLLAMRQASAGMQGRPPNLAWLTELGQAAYIMLTNQPPLRSELATQSSHVSDAHMLLNLEAADLLQKAGYEILAHGHRHYLDGVRQAVPDLTVCMDGEIIYIEVERSGKKSSRPEKWVNLCELTEGQIYIFCQYPRSQKQIAAEVQKALIERNLTCCLTLTNLADLRKGYRGPDGSFWLEQIDISPGQKV
jgi:hypothetical protein